MFGEKPKAFQITDLDANAKAADALNAEAPKANTGPLNLESTFDTPVAATETVAEAKEAPIMERDPGIERLANGGNYSREKGLSLLSGASEKIGTYASTAGENISRLVNKAAEGSGKFFGSIGESWKAGMESAKKERALSGQSLEAAETSLKESLNESTRATDAARDKVANLSDNFSPEAAADARKAIEAGVEKNLKAGQETAKVTEGGLKGITNWFKKIFLKLGVAVFEKAGDITKKGNEIALRHKTELLDKLDAISSGEPVAETQSEAPAAETTAEVAPAPEEADAAEVISTPPAANDNPEVAPEEPVHAFDAGIEEAFKQNTFAPVVPEVGGAEPLAKPEQPEIKETA